MKYQNKKNNKVAKLIDQNEKYKTVMLEFDNGFTQTITTSTFKRWWKKLDEDTEYISDIMEQKKELGIEIPQIKPEDVTIVEVVAEQKQPNSDITVDIMVDIIVDLAKSCGYGIKHADGSRWVVLTVNKKARMEIYVGKRHIRMSMKSKLLPDFVEYKKINNYYLDASINIPYNNMEENLRKFLSYSI